MIKIFTNKVLKLICLLLMTSNLLFIYYVFNNSDRINNYSKIILDITTLSEVKQINLKKELDIVDLAEEQTNVALNYYNEWKTYPKSDDWTEKGLNVCDTSLPSIETIAFNNIFWQTIPNTNKTQYFLYNAYYDNRGDTKYVRIVGNRRYPMKNKLRFA